MRHLIRMALAAAGRLAYAAAYGFAHLSPDVPATAGTRYQIASISKTLTAQAMLRLERAGKLSLDDKAGRWLPGLTGAGHVTSCWYTKPWLHYRIPNVAPPLVIH